MGNAIERMRNGLQTLLGELEADPIDCPVGRAAIEVAIETCEEQGRIYRDQLAEVVLTVREATNAFRQAQPPDKANSIAEKLDAIVIGSFVPQTQ